MNLLLHCIKYISYIILIIIAMKLIIRYVSDIIFYIEDEIDDLGYNTTNYILDLAKKMNINIEVSMDEEDTYQIYEKKQNIGEIHLEEPFYNKQTTISLAVCLHEFFHAVSFQKHKIYVFLNECYKLIFGFCLILSIFLHKHIGILNCIVYSIFIVFTSYFANIFINEYYASYYAYKFLKKNNIKNLTKIKKLYIIYYMTYVITYFYKIILGFTILRFILYISKFLGGIL